MEIASCVTLSKHLNLPVLHFFICKMGIIPVPTAEGCVKMSLLTKICDTKDTLTKNNLMVPKSLVTVGSIILLIYYTHMHTHTHTHISCC